jgi:predicted chitinase
MKGYGSYNKNKNAMISKGEFAKGQRADRETAEKQLRLEGRLKDGVAKRLRQDTLGVNRKLPKKQLKIDANAIASLLGSPSANVRKAMPGIMAAMKEAGITDRATMIAVLATIRTEVGSFLPIHEYGGPSYYAQYNGRDDLGNRDGTNDGIKYHGRGYIQLTGRANYGTYGRAIGENLVKNPNKALTPKVAAEILTAYFKARGIPELAKRGDWVGVRAAVNGGDNGLETFQWAVSRLKASKGWLKKGY